MKFSELLEMQKQAQKTMDLTELNKINKQLYEIREHNRVQKELEREKARDERIAMKIYNLCEQDNEPTM